MASMASPGLLHDDLLHWTRDEQNVGARREVVVDLRFGIKNENIQTKFQQIYGQLLNEYQRN